MTTELKHGKLYYVPFIAPYTEKGPYHVKVSAVAKKSTLYIYGDFDIRSTFFAEQGLKTYLTMVDDTTDIYICHPITSEDPPELDEGTMIFIPKSIIDFSKVDEYSTMTRIAFNIEGTRRHFDNRVEFNEFIDKFEKEVKQLLSHETVLANDIVTITNTRSDLLVRESIIATEDNERKLYIERRNQEKQRLDKANADRETDFLKLKHSVEEREKILIEKENTIQARLNDAHNRTIIANKWLSMIDALLKRIEAINDQVRRIGQEANIVNLLTWNDILNNIYDQNSAEIGEFKKWQTALLNYMNSKHKIETLPEELAKHKPDNSCNLCQRPFK